MKRQKPSSVFVLALLALTATSAFAQAPAPAAPAEPPRRPNRAVYGGNERDRRTGQSLDLTLSGEGTYDDNAAAALQGGTVDPLTQYQGGGFGGGGVATLSY